MQRILRLLLIPLLLTGCGEAMANGPVDKLRADTAQKICPLKGLEFARKGSLFFYWGYNFSWYTQSDIRFTGRDYEFTVFDVEGADQPATKFMTYIDPKLFTVPQYNWRLGYQLNDRHSISIGNDHMKYVMSMQKVKMTGTVSSGDHAGAYDNETIIVGEFSNHSHEGGNGDGHTHTHAVDTLYASGIASTLEHCDGLNDMTVEYGWTGNLWVSKNDKHAIALNGTVSVGGLVPDTEANVLGAKDPSHGDEAHTIPGLHPDHNAERKNKGYHLAGYSVSAGLGVQANFFKHVFLLARVKGGYINMPDIITTHEGGRASQRFGFLEPMLVAGYSFSLHKR